MVMAFNLKFDDRKFRRFLDRDLRRHLDFAMAQTLTQTAFEARKEIQRNIDSKFDGGKGKDFIKRSIVVDRATKLNQRAEVGLLERADFFAIHEEGGTREPQNKFLAVRRQARAGRAGRPGRVLQRPRVYQTPRGIFQRLRKTTRQLWQYIREARYRKRPWLAPGAERAGRRLNDLFIRNLDRAIR